MHFKKVKIVATIGPATHSEEKILELAEAGVDVFRMNLSHATPEEVVERFRWIRGTEEKLGRTFAILGDLPGPKIRIGDMEPDVMLEVGCIVTIQKEDVLGTAKQFSLNHPEIIDDIQVGAQIFLEDGIFLLEVVEKLPESVKAKVLVGGMLKPRKGFSAEGIALHTPELSEKDKKWIELMVDLGADLIAVSFVQTAKDIENVRTLLPKDQEIGIIPKIETAAGVRNAEEILDVSDGLMVARGDLGLAVPVQKVPHIQKELIKLCIRKAKPVITATQCLDSMIRRPLPTRAEVTDVANAILDGTDAVMLSGESAEGNFPIQTVQMMTKIIRETEQYVNRFDVEDASAVQTALGSAVGQIAGKIGSQFVVAFTQTGGSARFISRHRHAEAIFAASDDLDTLRKLNLSWGVYPIPIHETKDFNDMVEQAKDIARDNPVHPLKSGEQFVIVAGIPYGQSGSTNMILVEKV